MREWGRIHALEVLGLKTAAARALTVRPPRDPYADVQKKLTTAFKVKTPKFDFAALTKRLLNNPLKQPQLHISGKWPGLKQ